MLELFNLNQEILNTNDRIKIDVIKDGQEFLEQFDINQDLLLDAVSIIYRFLRITKKIPHNLFKFFIAAYYIVSRHPKAFPMHQSKKEFCRKFGLQKSSLDYSVEKITNTLSFIRILDDKKFPYYINPKTDLCFQIVKNIVKTEVDKVVMKFLFLHQPFNSQFISEDLVSTIIFEMKLLPEELFRQIFEIILNLVEKCLQTEYACIFEYIQLYQKYFI